jgi:hypothetical protein
MFSVNTSFQHVLQGNVKSHRSTFNRWQQPFMVELKRELWIHFCTLQREIQNQESWSKIVFICGYQCRKLYKNLLKEVPLESLKRPGAHSHLGDHVNINPSSGMCRLWNMAVAMRLHPSVHKKWPVVIVRSSTFSNTHMQVSLQSSTVPSSRSYLGCRSISQHPIRACYVHVTQRCLSASQGLYSLSILHHNGTQANPTHCNCH